MLQLRLKVNLFVHGEKNGYKHRYCRGFILVLHTRHEYNRMSAPVCYLSPYRQ